MKTKKRPWEQWPNTLIRLITWTHSAFVIWPGGRKADEFHGGWQLTWSEHWTWHRWAERCGWWWFCWSEYGHENKKVLGGYTRHRILIIQLFCLNLWLDLGKIKLRRLNMYERLRFVFEN